MTRRLLGLALLLACARAEPPPAARPPLALRTSPAGDSLRLTLAAAPGWKINARLKPVLESRSRVLARFDSPRRTADSAYFTEAPVAVVPGREAPIRGTLRASICAPGEGVCRVVAIEISEK